MALNPFIADIGNLLPQVISGVGHRLGRAVAADHGPDAARALQSQDMYLAGSFLMFLAVLTVIGVFVSDLLLAVLDPRIRLSRRGGGRHDRRDAACAPSMSSAAERRSIAVRGGRA